MYHDSHGVLPSAGDYRVLPAGATYTDGLRSSWTVAILPYIEQAAQQDQIDYPLHTYTYEANKLAAMNPVSAYLCPSQDDTRTHHFRISGRNLELYGGEETYTVHYQGVAGPKGEAPNGENYPWDRGIGFGGFALGGVIYRDSKVALGDILDEGELVE